MNSTFYPEFQYPISVRQKRYSLIYNTAALIGVSYFHFTSVISPHTLQNKLRAEEQKGYRERGNEAQGETIGPIE